MWTARPVFISSTFLDMQAERDYLRTRVFPELEEKLRARRHNLEWVDLRVGVATAAERDVNARELHVLKVCLAEVKRCRPFLIVLLGDRYGWAPPEDRVRAAAAEEGFEADIAGRSITDLEIDFGVLSDPEQQPRSMFYFRDPLPYQDMPPELAALFSNDYERDPGAADHAQRLATLKQRIETQLPTRVRHYAAQWDTEHQCVTGLEDFGRTVLTDIWSELDAETAGAVAAAEIPWQQAERDALDDFAEDRARDFVGRQEIIARLTNLCLSPAQDGGSRGICVTGDPGSGKSALFGALYHPPKPETEEVVPANQRHRSGSTCRLGGSDVFLLAHAAGASVVAASVDSMLRRWIDELAAALGIRDVGLAENADAETVEATFVQLLGRKASQQRVVVLVDALDQFETTTRGRYVTWLPRLWPANARLIATAIAGDASKVLAERPGMEALSLPPLDAAEARGIVKGICDRYHREFEPEVVDALLAKTGAAGPAWGNPLWLVIAVEELNLLDADDFDRARTYAGRPDEQLRTLMLEFITKFPGDIPGLYGHTFDRAEKLFGAGVTRGFLGLIAVSRAGWREGDFRILLPRVSGELWDELQFAQLRRLFRGQMRRRGALSRWDFNHVQMRAAVRARLAGLSIPEQKLHAMIADRLLSCPPDDPLHLSETMVHLFACEDWARAARYYGDSSLSEAEVQGATRALADAVIAPGAGRATDVAQQFCRLLHAPDLDESVGVQVGRRFTFELNDAIEQQAALDVRLILAEGVKTAFERLFRLKPNDRNRQRDLSASYIKVGEVLVAQGNLPEALKSFHDGHDIFDRLAKADPGNARWLRPLSLSYNKIGDVLVAQGNLTDALKSFCDGLAIRRSLVKADPSNVGWQRDLAASYIEVGDVLAVQGNLTDALKSFRDGHEIFDRLAKADPGNAQWQRDLSVSYNKVGGALKAQGNLPEAVKCFRTSHDIFDRLAKADPSNAGWQRDLSESYSEVGGALKAQGNLPEALKSFRDGLVIAECLAKADPSNAGWLRGLSVLYNNIGDVLVAQGNLSEALKSFRASHDTFDRLAKADPGNAGWQRDLSVSYLKVGAVQKAKGNLPEALKSFRASHDIFDRLAKADPSNADWLRNLSASHIEVGGVQVAQGNLPAALTSYQASLAIADRLAKVDPGNAGWQRDLSVSYDNIGELQVAQGNLPEALKSFRDGLAIRDRLAKSDPSNAGWQQDLSILYGSVGDVLVAQGNLSEALELFRASHDIFDRLAKVDPGNAQWQRVLSVSYNKVGGALKAQGHLPEALKSFRDGLAIAERLAKADPSNDGWQRDLAVSYGMVGLVQVEQGDLAGALKAFRDGLAIFDRLAKADPSNDGRRSDLSMSYTNIGNVLKAQGNLPEALKFFRDELAIRDRLAKADPGNARWQRDLIVSYVKIAQLDPSEARAMLTRAAEVVSQMQSRGQLVPRDAELQAKHNLAINAFQLGDLQAAQSLQQELLATHMRLHGAGHPETTLARENLKLTLRAAGDRLIANVADDPNDIDAMGNLANALRQIGDFEGEGKLRGEIVTRIGRLLGPDDTRTLAAKEKHAIALGQLGDHATALRLAEEVLATKVRLLGADHSISIKAKGNLAVARYNAGDLAGARALEEEVLATCSRLLGPRHPDTLHAKENLLATLRLIGDPNAERAIERIIHGSGPTGFAEEGSPRDEPLSDMAELGSELMARIAKEQLEALIVRGPPPQVTAPPANPTAAPKRTARSFFGAVLDRLRGTSSRED